MSLAVFEDGFYNDENFSISCSEAMNFGKVFAEPGFNIAAGMSGNTESVFHALASGLLETGKNIWSCGKCTKAELRHAVEISKADGGVYLDYSCGNIKIFAMSQHGFPITVNDEKKILANLNAHKENRCECGKLTDMSALSEVYRAHIKRLFRTSGSCKNIQIHSSSPMIQTVFSSIGEAEAPDFATGTSFHISDDGTGASAYSHKSGFVFRDRLILICCLDEFEKGNDVFLPESFPAVAEAAAQSCSVLVRRFDPYASDEKNMLLKKNSLRHTFLYDGAALVHRVISIMNSRNTDLDGLSKRLPRFTTAVRYVSLNKLSEKAAEKLKSNSENGVCLKNEDGRITIRKSKSGKSLMFFAESYSTESADEFCSNFFKSSGIN